MDASSEPCSDLRAILDECDLSYVFELFNNAKITRAMLSHMTRDDLESIGLKPGPIAVIMGVLGRVCRSSRASIPSHRASCTRGRVWGSRSRVGSATCNYGMCELDFESGLVATLS